MNEEIDKLSPVVAKQLLISTVSFWIENNGLKAFVLNQRFNQSIEENNIEMPNWLNDDDYSDTANLVVKLSLSSILDGEDRELSNFLKEELSSANAHALDPISLGIIGGTIIGSILAARVKRIGNTTFYEGIPKELKKILGQNSKIINDTFE